MLRKSMGRSSSSISRCLGPMRFNTTSSSSSGSSSDNTGFFRKALDGISKNRQGQYEFVSLLFTLILIYAFMLPLFLSLFAAIVNGIGMYFVLSYAVYNYKVKLAWEEFQVYLSNDDFDFFSFVASYKQISCLCWLVGNCRQRTRGA